MKILHVITGLNNGGAEGVLFRLCKYDVTAEHIVVSLMDEGKYGPLLNAEGVKVTCLNLPAGKINLLSLWHLFNIIRLHKPDVVQTWMYHADLIGGFLARIIGVKNVFWNVRHTTLVPNKSKKSTILIAKLCAYLSLFIPKKIICCAEEARLVHSDIGYEKSKMVVIQNGYDLSHFSVCTKLGNDFRSQVFLKPNDVLLGMVGRFDIQKDHFGLLRALSYVKESIDDFKFIFIGRDMNSKNLSLVNEIEKNGLQSNVILLDQRTDIPSVMNALDMHVLSSSFGEGFPNVIAEAMACGTPCITTDVGDAAHIVGSTGWVVPPQNPVALSDSILLAINELKTNPQGWQFRTQSCRKLIQDNFCITEMINKYHSTWSVHDYNC